MRLFLQIKQVWMRQAAEAKAEASQEPSTQGSSCSLFSLVKIETIEGS
jgi:hypothetical protein